MHKENIDFIKNENLVKENQLTFLLGYVLSEEENILAIFEDIQVESSLNPVKGYFEEENAYILTNKKIIIIMIKENSEIVDITPIKSIRKISIERDTPSDCNKDWYTSVNRVKNIVIEFKKLDPITINKFDANEHFSRQLLKEKAVNFIKKINEII